LNGTEYLVFMLDSNQSGTSYSQHTIEMTKLQIFTSNDPNQTTTSFDANGILQLNGTLVYNLGYNVVKATAQGSGKADFFSSKRANSIYLYSAFGKSIASSRRFEAWVFVGGPVAIPEMGTFFPVIGLLVAGPFNPHAGAPENRAAGAATEYFGLRASYLHCLAEAAVMLSPLFFYTAKRCTSAGASSEPLERAEAPAKGLMQFLEIGLARYEPESDLGVRKVHKERALPITFAV